MSEYGEEPTDLEAVIARIESGVRPVDKEVAGSLREILSDKYHSARQNGTPLGDLLPIAAQLITSTDDGYKSLVVSLNARRGEEKSIQEKLFAASNDLVQLDPEQVKFANSFGHTMQSTLRDEGLKTAAGLLLFADNDSTRTFWDVCYPEAFTRLLPDKPARESLGALCAFNLLQHFKVSDTPSFNIPLGEE